ncbi:phage protein D [Humibacillus xanthopallidus]|uniref:Phage protein D n=1 Tax=Humibacillus xanthopallidus TaxID=412689 RepID=A0A543PWV6_9MICO|nr:contractile injection system protein, VgrG/Pvc8 family [Humibacillus xanthopallidus]TQN48561.1 phage protein D [Humibacillus xanthopallidus]
MALPTAALYSARPTLQIDGSDSSLLTDHVLAVTVTETSEGMSRCEIVAGNWGSADSSDGYVFNDRRTVDFGTRVALRIGDGDRAGTLFDGVVTGIEAQYPQTGAPAIAFLAEDRLQELRMTRRTRSFEEASDADIIRSVVSEHGLSASVDVDGPVHHHVAQANQSDLAFIRERARLVDADLWIDGSSVHVASRGRRGTEDVTLTYNADLHEVTVLADLARQRSSVVVAGWDVSAKEAIKAEADSSAIQPELDGDTSGIDLLEQALASRADTIVHTAPATSTIAQAQADMALRTSARRFVTAIGLAEGDTRLRAGARVRLAGLGAGFEGRFTLVEVEHAFDGRRGYRTRFRAERPGLGSSA